MTPNLLLRMMMLNTTIRGAKIAMSIAWNNFSRELAKSTARVLIDSLLRALTISFVAGIGTAIATSSTKNGA